MIATQPKSAVAYLRRSTDRQEQSLGDQRKEIAHWAERNGFTIVQEYVDDAISGTSAKSRPGFQRLISDAQKGTFVAVIVWSSDRFSRGDVTETEYYRHVLRQAGVAVLSVTEDYLGREGIDGDVLRTVRQFQNRQYSVSLSQNTLRGQISSVLGASDPGRLTPYGYDREVVGPDGAVLYTVRFLEGGDREVRDRDGKVQTVYAKGQSLRKPSKQCITRLVLSDPARVRVVEDIYRMCVDGKGFKQIADELNRRCVISPKGRLWQFTTIKALIENPVYRGDVVWNRRTEGKFYEVRQGRADTQKPSVRSGTVQMVRREDWIVRDNAVPPIVDRATWERAQAAVAGRADCRGGKGRQAERWLLSGVLKCGACGQPFWGINKRKGRIEGRKDVVTAYYICSGRCRCGKSVCPVSAHVRADDLEAWVLGELKSMILADGEGMESAIDRFVEAVRGQRPSDVSTRSQKQEIAQIERQVDALVTGLDPANVALINDKLSQLRRRKVYLQEQVRAAEAEGGTFDEKALRRFATERIGLLGEMLAGARNEKVRQVMASYVDEIVIEPETKTGYMVVNAGIFGGNQADSSGAERETQEPNDPPNEVGGSQVNAIAGVGFEPTTSGL